MNVLTTAGPGLPSNAGIRPPPPGLLSGLAGPRVPPPFRLRTAACPGKASDGRCDPRACPLARICGKLAVA